MSTALVWLRYDLRLHDNEPLLSACADHEQVLLVYCFDPRHYRTLENGFKKTGLHRAEFLRQSIADLRHRLQRLGSDLYIALGAPVDVLPALAQQVKAAAVYVQQEIASEELADEAAVATALDQVPLHRIWGRTLYHLADLPFSPEEMPEPFKQFRRRVEKEVVVREPLPAPAQIPLPPLPDYGSIPQLDELGFAGEVAPELVYLGGETAALARLDYYTYDTELLTSYRYTRNRSLGADYSSKFSAYLAQGCLSPRTVYARVKEYEQTIKKNASTYWLVFEMIWRDFFQFQGMKYGNRMFFVGGIKQRQREWLYDHDLFARWCEGRTGVPFVDAHMRELNATGFMSNRGRVNCASFLTRDYRIDWRWGAAFFENRLLDYDVCSNWLNWNTQATEIWYTNPVWQGLKYDAQGEYVYHWLPELRTVPAPLVHAPFMAEPAELLTYGISLGEDYPAPVEVYTKWNWAIGRIRGAMRRAAGAEEE